MLFCFSNMLQIDKTHLFSKNVDRAREPLHRTPTLSLLVCNTVAYNFATVLENFSKTSSLATHRQASTLAKKESRKNQFLSLNRQKKMSDAEETSAAATSSGSKITYAPYEGEHEMDALRQLIDKDLSEPYSIFTYRYFINNWPELCLLAYDSVDGARKLVGAIVNKAEVLQSGAKRGYIAMLAVDTAYRHAGIGSALVVKAIEAMRANECTEVALEAEMTNVKAMALYLKLGFVKDKRLTRYYFSGNDAYRLKLWLK